MNRISLTANPRLNRLLVMRWPQWTILLVMLAGFLFAILAGFIGTPVGSRNFGIVFVWIAWWAALILAAVPLLGRGWCSICPIPLPGEWLQRGRLLGPGTVGARRLHRWPRALRNIWLQNLAFTLLALFSPLILTDPFVTSVILLAMLALAILMSLVFERRAFCRYLCPVGGFIGLYSQGAPIELRIREREVCLQCKSKACYNGSEQGYGCPWDVFPGGLEKNTYCGLCLECLRTCPSNNLSINLRPLGTDLEKPSARLDEALKAFIMLGSAMIYAGVLLGPWGFLKHAAYEIGSGPWLFYSAAFTSIIFLILPGAYWLSIKLGAAVKRIKMPGKKAFSEISSSLIPLGLAFWIAFSLSFVLSNASYILMTLSDPFGWGWNLFGSASMTWKPVLTWLAAPLQTLVLTGGLVWSSNLAVKNMSRHGLAYIPTIVYMLIVTLMMGWLLL